MHQIRTTEVCRRLDEVFGIGPITASAVYAAAGNGTDFVKGRHVCAGLGLVQAQHASGAKAVLLRISKRGNTYLRSLFIHSARAVLRYSAKNERSLQSLGSTSIGPRGHTKAWVAVANKMARIALGHTGQR